jgi:hypothetical protein
LLKEEAMGELTKKLLYWTPRILCLLFAALGVLYLVWAWGKFHISAYIFISGPLFLLAGLFLANWILRKKLRSAT